MSIGGIVIAALCLTIALACLKVMSDDNSEDPEL